METIYVNMHILIKYLTFPQNDSKREFVGVFQKEEQPQINYTPLHYLCFP